MFDAQVVQEPLLVVVADMGEQPVPGGRFRPKVAGSAVGRLAGNRGEHSFARGHDYCFSTWVMSCTRSREPA